MTTHRDAPALNLSTVANPIDGVLMSVALSETKAQWTLREIKAWWVFSEMRSKRTSFRYPPAQLMAFQNFVEFADVPDKCHEILANLWEPARGVLNEYLVGVTGFVLELWTDRQLGMVSAMWQMDPAGKGDDVSMLAFEKSLGPSSRHVELLEAVNGFISSGEKLQVKDPVIVGLTQQHRPVLIDGYFRGTVFIRRAGASERIPVFVPQ